MRSRWFERRELIDLTGQIDRENAIHCGGGRFGDIYKCNCREPSGASSVVAVKSLRCFSASEDQSDAINKDLRRELGLWRRLDCSHRNIVPLLGMTKGFGPVDAIVSAWMPNGTLHSFLKNAGKTSLLVQRLSILSGIASCLEYLHSIPVLHGDLTSSNILIDEEGNPRLTDFGLSSALGKLQTGMSYLNRCSTDPGAVRWAAPELFDDKYVPKPSADVYSFGCIMLEVLGGKIPWEDKPETVVIGLKIIQRKFPDRPASSILQDEHWSLIVMCWSLPDERPSAQQVVHYLAVLKSADMMGPRHVQEAVSCGTEYPTAAKKRALLIAIRHVQGEHNLHNIHWAHRDALELYRNLIDSQGYRAEDIVLMIDDTCRPRELWPTRGNILRQIDQLVSGAPDNCRFFFYYTGHAVAEFEVSGTDQGIIAGDGKTVLNDILHDRLVTPLNRFKGSKLFALFDCSHSEKLLVYKGSNAYSREWSVGPGERFKAVAVVIVNLLRLYKKHSRRRNPPQARRADSALVTISESEFLDVARAGTDEQQPSVVSLAACRTRQLAHDDDERQLTLTKSFLDALTTKPDLSWVELRDELKARIEEMRARSEEYLRTVLARDVMPFELWTQEPRYSTTPYTMDLTQPVEF